MPHLQVVSKSSANIGGYEPIAVSSKHRNIHRYLSRDAPTYQLLQNQIETMLEKISSSTGSELQGQL